MFQFARELRRIFGAEGFRPHQDGLTGGESALLELLDLPMLTTEGRAADVAAGRVGAKDRAQRRLEAAIVWREIARRSGDAVALRKAASTAESAAAAFDRNRRPDGWARARCEQAFCAMLGAELFGDEGLNAAADVAFREARAAARGGLAAALADIGVAAIEARANLGVGDASAARAAAAAFSAPVAALESLRRRFSAARPLAAEARTIRADLLAGWGARLKDVSLLEEAGAEAARAAALVESQYEPLTWSRAETVRAQALALMGEFGGEVERVTDSVTALTEVMETFDRDHSPLDWARVQVALGQSLHTLGEAVSNEQAFEQAVGCFERAEVVLRTAPSSPLRGLAVSSRAVCLVRSAELTGDLAVLDSAEAAMKMELARTPARRDPVAWALAQVHLARLYEARMDMTGKDRGERAKAVMALDAALDVFSEHGLRSLSAVAVDAMNRLKPGARQRPSQP